MLELSGLCYPSEKLRFNPQHLKLHKLLTRLVDPERWIPQNTHFLITLF